MNDDLLRKVKMKRLRIIAILAVVALFAGSTIFAMSVRQAREDKEATTEPVAQEEVQTQEEQPSAEDEEKQKKEEEAKKAAKKAKKQAAKVDELIEAIGEVRLDKDDLIKEARAEYDALPESAQKKVKNLETLEEAEKKLKELEKEDKEKKAEEKKKEEQEKVEKQKAEKKSESEKTVTIEINCSELSKNMDKLTDEGLAKYVPSNGVILGKTKYTFKKSATVYDALKKVCRDNGVHYIQETGAGYTGVYISSIGHLAEFDGGKNSGWMYKVNGSTPNVSCSEYDLSDGDKIYWFYTVDYKKE